MIAQAVARVVWGADMTLGMARQSLEIVLIGPPGAGKSTIAEAAVARLRALGVAATVLLRAEIKARSRIGRAVAGALAHGDLAPDSLMDRVLRASIETLDPAQGVLLDGYPRTMRQALGLDVMRADFGRDLDAVLALEVADGEVIRRLSGRRICEGAGEPFPVHIDDLASMLRCQERGGVAVHRDDDHPDVVLQRLAVYRAQTAPLLEHYEARGVLRRIDASGSPADVARRAVAALAPNAPVA